MSKKIVQVFVALAFVAFICVAAAPADELLLNGSFENGKSTNTPGWNPGIADVPLGLSAPGVGIDYWTLGGTDKFRWYAGAEAQTYYGMLAPNDGSRYVNILGTANNAYFVSQSFSVAAGQTYNVSFYEAYRQVLGGGGEEPGTGDDGGADGILFGVTDTVGSTLTATLSMGIGTLTGQMGVGLPAGTSFSGSGSGILTMVTADSNANWTNYTFSFTPSASGTATLKFYTTQTSGDGTYLDNVSVQGNPIPEPGTLALLVAGLFGVLVYAWRKRK